MTRSNIPTSSKQSTPGSSLNYHNYQQSPAIAAQYPNDSNDLNEVTVDRAYVSQSASARLRSTTMPALKIPELVVIRVG